MARTEWTASEESQGSVHPLGTTPSTHVTSGVAGRPPRASQPMRKYLFAPSTRAPFKNEGGEGIVISERNAARYVSLINTEHRQEDCCFLRLETPFMYGVSSQTLTTLIEKPDKPSARSPPFLRFGSERARGREAGWEAFTNLLLVTCRRIPSKFRGLCLDPDVRTGGRCRAPGSLRG